MADAENIAIIEDLRKRKTQAVKKTSKEQSDIFDNNHYDSTFIIIVPVL